MGQEDYFKNDKTENHKQALKTNKEHCVRVLKLFKGINVGGDAEPYV